MRFPYPEFLPLKYVVLFAALLFCGQILVGTDAYFASCVFAHIIVFAIAFNLVGGLYRPSGAFIFFNAVLVLILPQCAKVLLGEPAQSNLHLPDRTITVYLVGEIGILFAALIARRFFPQKPLLVLSEQDVEKIPSMAMGAFLLGAVIPLIPAQYGHSGTALSFLHQLAFFLPLSIILAVYYEIRTSQGRRSLNLLGLLSISVSLVWGIYGASRQGIFTPVVAYLLVCMAMRFRFRMQQVVAIAIAGFICVAYLNPYALAARNYRSSPNLIDIEINLLSNPSALRNASKQDDTFDPALRNSYYNSDMGFLDRLTLLPVNALLIEHADAGYRIGWFPIIAAFDNFIPHVIWPNKPNINFGNQYAHTVGMLGSDDYTTGISFGMFSEAYYIAGWFGLLVAIPLLVGAMFIVVEWVVGSLHQGPWPFVMIVYFIHAASDAILSQVPVIMVTITAELVITVVVTRYILAPIGNFFTVTKRQPHLPRRMPVRSGSGIS
jgi:hypothetical protein